MAQSSISVDSVTKRFPLKGNSDGVVALDDISLSVGESEFVALLGPSGCGKSTLLRLGAHRSAGGHGNRAAFS